MEKWPLSICNLKMDQVKIFVINLKRSPERRNEIARLMTNHNLDFKFFDAIDGTTLSQEIINKSRERSNHWYKLDEGPEDSMKLGEIGVAMSHYKLYQKILQENLPMALIMEDDINFDKRLSNLIKSGKIAKLVSKNFDLVLLGYCTHDVNFRKSADTSYWNRQRITKEFYVGIPVKWYWSAIGYVINQNAARLLINKQGDLPCVTADILTANSPQYGVKLGVLSKQIIWPGPLNDFSTIQVHKLNSSETSSGNDYKKDTKKYIRIFNKNINLFKRWAREQKLKISRKKYLFIKSKY